jgi:succinylglutamate desuccinylase
VNDLQHKLRDLHLELGQAHRLDPNDRAMLETVLRDLRDLLDQPEE